MGKSNPSLFKLTPAAPGERHFADMHTIKSVCDKFLVKNNNIFGQGVKTKEFDKEANRFGNSLNKSVAQYESTTFFINGKKVLVNEISNNMVDRYLNKTTDASLGRKPPIIDGNNPPKVKDVAKGRIAAFSTKSKKIGEGKLEESWKYLQFPSHGEAVSARKAHFDYRDDKGMHSGNPCALMKNGKLSYKGTFHGPKPEKKETIKEVSTKYLLNYLSKASKSGTIRSVKDAKTGAKAASRLNFIDHANSIVDDGQKKYHEAKIELVKSTILNNRKK